MGHGGRITEELIEVNVDSIRVHMPTGQHVVILKEKQADRYLPSSSKYRPTASMPP